MELNPARRCSAFAGTRRIARSELREVALKIKEALEQGERNPVLIFDDSTSELVEVDLRGSAEEVLGRLAGPSEHEQTRGPGRPKLGVVAREVTLLPRHWEWLSQQPGGASVALRKLVEEARRVNADKDRQRQAEEAAYRFMSAMAGNEPGYEEALRALFGGNRVRFEEMVARWPQDVREHAIGLAAAAFGATSPG